MEKLSALLFRFLHKFFYLWDFPFFFHWASDHKMIHLYRKHWMLTHTHTHTAFSRNPDSKSS
uniref:Trehalose-6-phosphate synthase-8 n=1 Tax=Rhizophora mucronata TaxID=61149 RepID=A0A2P2MI31_RHIMU